MKGREGGGREGERWRELGGQEVSRERIYPFKMPGHQINKKTQTFITIEMKWSGCH